MYNKIASLILNSWQSSGKSGTEIFIAQPDASKESLAGKLFILLEIETEKTQALKISNFLLNNLNYNYYQNEKIILRERIRSLKVEHIFETALAKTNKNLAEFLLREKIKINPRFFNVTVGIIYENELYFSNLGKNKTFLIYRNTKKAETKKLKSVLENDLLEYKITEIGHDGEKKPDGKESRRTAQLSLNKLFANVISGQIPPSAYFLASNEALPEYLSQKQLIDIITKLPPSGAAEHIKNILSKVNAYVSFAGIIIKNTTGLEARETEAPLAPVSLPNLDLTEQKTEKILTPSGIINTKKWLEFFSGILTKIKPKKTATRQKLMPGDKKQFFLKDKIFFKKKPSYFNFNKIFLALKNIIIYLINLIFYVFKFFTDSEHRSGAIKSLKSLGPSLMLKYRELIISFKRLNKKNKVLLIAASIFILLFALSLTYTNIKNNQAEKLAAAKELTQLIEQKQNQIDANLLYSNEVGAKIILGEIKDLIASLPRNSEEEISVYNKFLEKNEAQLERIRHVVKIYEPKELANFINLNSQAEAENIILISGGEKNENRIYSGDSGDKNIYYLNLSSQLITAIADLSQIIVSLKYPMADKNNNVFYLNSESLVELRADSEEISKLNLSLPEGLKNIASAASFNNRLYLLDSQNNQIYRLSKQGNDFSLRDNWLLEKTDLSQAVDLSIDGQVYVLNKNGQVFKFLKGKREDFELEAIEPEFINASGIYASSELEFLYVLEPEQKRLAVFDKTGNFILQYQSDKFNNLKDFAVDEKSKKIYFLNANSIYEIDAVHFEK